MNKHNMQNSPYAFPYVYKITHAQTKQFYYGYREANEVSATKDLGIFYFTSSTVISELGFNNFAREIIAEFIHPNRDTAGDDAWDFEQQLISQNLQNPLCLNEFCRLNNKNRFKRTNRGENNPFYGKKHSHETLQQMSFSHKGENNGMFNKNHSEETKRKISDSKKGTISPFKGLERPDKTKKKISEHTKLAMQRPEVKEKLRLAILERLEKCKGKITVWKNGKKKIIFPDSYTAEMINEGWVRSKQLSLTA